MLHSSKQPAIEGILSLYTCGNSIDEITRKTGQTVKKYLKEERSLCNGHCDDRRPSKLAPYEKEVLKLRVQGITYIKIHELISAKGYVGSVASLRMFMQKERIHMIASFTTEN